MMMNKHDASVEWYMTGENNLAETNM